ncbi:hypothetical protein HEK131_44670 [Streptomyces seoulensis]|nr:hypothetical protein HEK131_44670 [Streptomyces seoulensis]
MLERHDDRAVCMTEHDLTDRAQSSPVNSPHPDAREARGIAGAEPRFRAGRPAGGEDLRTQLSHAEEFAATLAGRLTRTPPL